MALIVRIDVDRPYGRQPLARHVLSRLSSDVYFPRVDGLGYLRELAVILKTLNRLGSKAYVFFRRCTLPSEPILELMSQGGHEIGLHLENSRSYECFVDEKRTLERHTGRAVLAVSKHGSGGAKYGLRHYAPYEPEKYVEWARQSGMKVFFGNAEDPSLKASVDGDGFRVYPSAFWLEPAWRDTRAFTIDWLLGEARHSDIVLLLHPENVLADPALCEALERLLSGLDTRIPA